MFWTFYNEDAAFAWLLWKLKRHGIESPSQVLKSQSATPVCTPLFSQRVFLNCPYDTFQFHTDKHYCTDYQLFSNMKQSNTEDRLWKKKSLFDFCLRLPTYATLSFVPILLLFLWIFNKVFSRREIKRNWVFINTCCICASKFQMQSLMISGGCCPDFHSVWNDRVWDFVKGR